jgi:hypothetical protein
VNDFDELIGADVAGADRERLRAVHELLVEAGPPPELPASLRDVPQPGKVSVLRKHAPPRKAALIAAAVMALVVAFTGGFATGDHVTAPTTPVAKLVLKGTSAAPHARATLAVLPNVDGNWPMTLTVRGLPSVAAPTYYVVWLVRHGQPFAPCGSFVVSKSLSSLTLKLNAPYSLKTGDTWIVTQQKYGRHATRTTVLEPRAL